MGLSASSDWTVGLTAVERLDVRTSLVALGHFRCPVGHPQFSGGGPQPCAYVVFPRHPVRIIPRRGRPALCTSALAAYYNIGDVYDREAVSPEGDRCDWIALSPALLADVAGPVGETAAAAFDGCFAPLRSAHFVRQRQLFERCRGDAVPDPLALDEAAVGLLRALLVDAESGWRDRTRRGRPPRAATLARNRRIVDQAQELIATRLFDDDGLDDLARELACSPGHLARAFLTTTGSTLHRYRTELRLREGLHRLPDHRGRLNALAADLGFASQSHFGEQFRRALGMPPAAYLRSTAQAARTNAGLCAQRDARRW